VIKLSSYFEKYFVNSQTYKNVRQASYKIFSRQRGIHVTCLQIQQIVMVHGGVREVQPGYSDSQIAIWHVIFYVKKRHKSDHPNIRTFVLIHNSAKETGYT
jgi:hypothetical protein